MARERRIRRSVLLDVDTGGIGEELEKLGLMWSEKNDRKLIHTAWNAALKRTGITLRRWALNEAKDALAPRRMTRLRDKRLVTDFRPQAVTGLDEMKVWFGLNKIKVRDLKGRISGKALPRHPLRDARTGRYIPATARSRREYALTFTPQGNIDPETYPGAFRARVRDGKKGDEFITRKSILVRGDNGRVREAEVSVYAALADRIEDNVFDYAGQIMLKNFMSELRFRAGLR